MAPIYPAVAFILNAIFAPVNVSFIPEDIETTVSTIVAFASGVWFLWALFVAKRTK